MQMSEILLNMWSSWMNGCSIHSGSGIHCKPCSLFRRSYMLTCLLGEPTLNKRRVRRTFAAWISVSSILMSLDSGLSTQTKNRSDFWNATLCACLPQIERRNDQIYDDDVLKIWMPDACMCRIVLSRSTSALLN